MKCREKSMGGYGRGILPMLLALLFHAFAGPSIAQTGISQVGENADPVGQYAKFEITFALDTLYANPFDPDEADVCVVFTTPSGATQTVIAFWSGAPFPTQPARDWHARFAAEEPGIHRYRILVNDRNGRGEAGPFEVSVVPSTRPGFIRLDPYNRNTLRRSSGEPYHPVGHNLAWPERFGTADYERWLGRFSQQGLTWSRVWMNPYSGQGLEWEASDPTGRYYGIGRYSQPVSQFFDQLLTLAEQNGVAFQMCVFSFNELSTSSFSNWEANPYNAANGGPLITPLEFFTNPTVRESIRKLLRYIIARWGYSTSVFCWELFNEFNIITRTDFINPGEWHSEMAGYIKSVDAFRHPVTTSLTNQLSGGLWNDAFWQRPELDIIEEHRYSTNIPEAFILLADDGTFLGKPTLIGEIGTNPGGWYDTNGEFMRKSAWASALRLSGTMYWWWQSIDAVNTYPVYRPLVVYLQGEDFGAYGLRPASFQPVGGPSGMRIYGIQSDHRAYFWITAPSSSPVTGMRVNGGRLAAGSYDIEFWRSIPPGGLLSRTRADYGDEPLSVSLPDFNNDIAVKVLPVLPEPTVTPIGPPTTPTATPVCGPGSLVSQGKPAFASSVFGTGFEATKANDGITHSEDSRWVSGSTGPHWWYVDLGSDYCISRLQFYSEESAGQSTILNVSGYRIRGSRTGTGSPLEWVLLGEFSDPCGAPYPSYNPNVTTFNGVFRYVAVEITRNDGVCGSYARVLEIQIFGIPWEEPTTPTPLPSGGPLFIAH